MFFEQGLFKNNENITINILGNYLILTYIKYLI